VSIKLRNNVINKFFVKKSFGFTLAEVIMYSLLVGIIGIFITTFFQTTIRGTKKVELNSLAMAELRNILTKFEIETDIYQANELLEISSTSIRFISDIVRSPNYDPEADYDGDGIINKYDADIDNDAPTRFFLSQDQQWKVGYNLEDDDDDNDGKIDVIIKIYWDQNSKEVRREIYLNETLYQNEVLGKVTKLEFSYSGSKREDLGKYIDVGNDGVAGTNDPGENDGKITLREIDWTLPPTGHGNRSGKVDTPQELSYITTIGLYLELDKNNDGIVDAKLKTELMPPMLVLKTKR
jgi:type II secretory pathway pseudopilin PulG